MNEHIIQIILAVFASTGFWTLLTNVITKPQHQKIMDKIDAVDGKITLLESQLSEMDAKNARTRILRASDEIYNGIKHSKDFFDQTLEDISKYEQYCRKHPDFQNGTTATSIKYIEDTYRSCMEKHSFI